MLSLEDLRNRHADDLRLAQARVALCTVLIDHAEALEMDGLELRVEDWQGRIALSLGLKGQAPEALPAAAPDRSASAGKATWTPEDDAQLLHLAAQGQGAKAIGPQIGRTWQAVAFRLKALKQAGDTPDAPTATATKEDADQPPAAEPEPPAAPTPPEPEASATPAVGADAFALNLDTLPTARERAAERRLRAIGYPEGCSPMADLALVEAVVRGDGMAAASEAAGMDTGLARQRWRALLPEVTIENQTALLTVLRARAKVRRAVA